MKQRITISILVCILLSSSAAMAADVLFDSQRTTFISVGAVEQPVVQTALALLQQDVQTVFGSSLQLSDQPETARIVAGTIGVNAEIDRLEKHGHIDLSALKGKWETFRLTTVKEDKQTVLIIAGSDPRGTAYGILELSRMIGVSPWYYFADVKPNTMKRFAMPVTDIQQSPSVQYRGIFLNDEDWGLLPWATQTLTPGFPLVGGLRGAAIGPKTYARIFELLLRLHANTIWPDMHETTVPFYMVEGNKEMATKYGIVVGTSHCEPLMRNSATEWDIAGEGDYNYVTNKENILSYWTDRLNELQGSENIYTIGLRGKHDGMMQGVTTLEEHQSVLSQVLNDQRKLLRKHVNPDPSQIPQIFVPYKEVLDVYDAGLEVPDEVTLVWCDDNYGYIRRLSNEKERLRSGGSGVYYHVSYWGRPHDYLWLASTSPALVHTEMQRAYEHGADKLWILNVGDIKPAEYLMEYFLDMAWNISVSNHLEYWAAREFGEQHSKEITAILNEYYRLANFRKPEHTGWSRVEEPGYPRNLTPVIDSEYNPDFNNELQNRLQNYLSLAEKVKHLRTSIPENRQSAFFQLVEYPVRGASLLNQKWLYAQLNDTINSRKAYDEIERITADYNSMENGKWNRIMDFHPRNLPVFDVPTFNRRDAINRVSTTTNVANNNIIAQNATQAVNAKNNGIKGLGHSFSAVPLVQNDSLTFVFDIQNVDDGWIKIAAIPNHDVDGQGMKIAISVLENGCRDAINRVSTVADYSVEGRNETWKQNVLRGQVLTTIPFNFQHKGKTTITIKALTPYIIIDQIMVGYGEMNFYEFPIKK
ncbi:MAG: glycosyl hydrolase 115 family protein, partial [Candidatus Symbiothrix sp.]|nr:glycosyl hydrolase 115 family protein [Candidatus Symbiothrix sp.]